MYVAFLLSAIDVSSMYSLAILLPFLARDSQFPGEWEGVTSPPWQYFRAAGR
jgi:hypothetical protein